MKITLLSKPGFSGNMLVRKIEEVAKSQLMDIEVFLNEHLQEAMWFYLRHKEVKI